MGRGLKVTLVILIILVGLFASSTGYLFAKTLSLQKKIDSSGQTAQSASGSTTIAASTTTKPSTTPTTPASTTPAPTGNRPSNPSDTVVVAVGETLMTIGQKNGVSWTAIADANGIDPNKIQAGQTIIIPKNGQVSFTVNQVVAQSLQKDVDGGKYVTRLDPVATAASDAPTVYGLAATDPFTQVKIDQTSGAATVTVVKNGKNYTISLVQPVSKGAKGIWAIESIKPTAS